MFALCLFTREGFKWSSESNILRLSDGLWKWTFKNLKFSNVRSYKNLYYVRLNYYLGQYLTFQNNMRQTIDSFWFANFDSPKWIKIFFIHFDSLCFPNWFNLIYSFWFGLILIRRDSWFTCESKIKSNQKSNWIQNQIDRKSNRIKNQRWANPDSLICE